MELSQEEFEEKFREAQDLLLQTMAESPEVDMEKFYSMVCLLENLAFFSPVVYSIIKKSKE